MGGTGCWAVAAAMPERFCCAVPLSGSIRISPENIAALSSLRRCGRSWAMRMTS